MTGYDYGVGRFPEDVRIAPCHTFEDGRAYPDLCLAHDCPARGRSLEPAACVSCGHRFVTCVPRLCPACGHEVLTRDEYDRRECV